MIYGYSERGIFNSIIYYLDANKGLIGKFLKKLGVNGFTDGQHTFTFLNEPSFSDFGDNDLTIIIDEETKKKTVVFIEGKVKTFNGKYCVKTEYNIILEALESKRAFKSLSSNLFVQLYYKYLLQEVVNSGKKDTSYLGIDDIFKKRNRDKDSQERVERSIGNNGVVLKACKKIKRIKEAEYYYIAILPKKTESENFQKGFIELNKKLYVKIETEKIRCACWEDIDVFFSNAENVIENFNYNDGQIY
jgi:hypothetical protein